MDGKPCVNGLEMALAFCTRSLGSTIGATAVGTLLNMGIVHYGTGELAAQLHELLNQPSGLTQLSASPAVRSVFDQALRWSFVGIVALGALTFVATWLIPITHAPRAAERAGRQARQAASH